MSELPMDWKKSDVTRIYKQAMNLLPLTIVQQALTLSHVKLTQYPFKLELKGILPV